MRYPRQTKLTLAKSKKETSVNNKKTFGNTPFNTELDIQKLKRLTEVGWVFPETIESIANLRNVEVIANVLWRLKQTLENGDIATAGETE